MFLILCACLFVYPQSNPKPHGNIWMTVSGNGQNGAGDNAGI